MHFMEEESDCEVELSDETIIGEADWKSLKAEAMKEEYICSAWFVSLS